MERSLLEQVNVKSMGARLNSRNVKPTYFPNFFGSVGVESLTWQTLIGEKGVPVMGDVISWDSSAPEKKRDTITKMSGDINKIALKRGMTEADWNKYHYLMVMANGDVNKKELLDIVFKDLDFVYNGVRARVEYNSMQIFSTAALSLAKTNNNGLITETAVDFGVPSGNKFGVTVDWSTAATATPLQDLEDLNEVAFNSGVTLKHFVMRRSDFLDLRNAAETTTKIKAWVNTKGNLLITKDTINQYMVANELPTIVVINPSVRFENEDNTRTIINPWERYRVVGVPELMVGDIQHVNPAAEGSTELAKKATMVKKDFVLTSKWGTLDPFKEWTMAEANAMPVLNDPSAMYYLRVDNATWA